DRRKPFLFFGDASHPGDKEVLCRVSQGRFKRSRFGLHRDKRDQATDRSKVQAGNSLQLIKRKERTGSMAIRDKRYYMRVAEDKGTRQLVFGGVVKVKRVGQQLEKEFEQLFGAHFFGSGRKQILDKCVDIRFFPW